MMFNLEEEVGGDSLGSWCQIWGVAIWLLWTWRNNEIFQEDFLKPTCPVEMIRKSWKLYCNSTDDVAENVVNPMPNSNTLSVDGAVSQGSKKAGCGGIIRNNKGEWISGFSHFLGRCDVEEAEEWAILLGLRLAWDEGFRRIMVESDSKMVIDKLLSGSTDITSSLVFLQIREMLCRAWEVKLHFAPRSLNALADAMAKRGLTISNVLNVCPDSLRHVLAKDCMRLDPLTIISNI
ncbi:hypothetical protein QN277_019646 [Acacia crassicarpa]|uniref:RNase H type-1 domain-containing protein n=1 Tax=Acacia crassicarpa TaxID=499986 RepID=A0AAE1MMF3_9FABA|nr:hypothetical protein QN277_019646 [Acacia crassicarpa]